MRASKAWIGAFVVGAVVLASAGVLLFGSGRFFEDRTRYVLYFDKSVAGLNPGSPVLLNGVKIGDVETIDVVFDVDALTFRTPVVIETHPNFILVISRELTAEFAEKFGGDRQRIRREITARLVERGLRAQLKLQSFVTGQLAVELVFKPDVPAKLVGGGGPYMEIPTAPSGMDKVLESIADLPVKEIVADFRSAIARLNELLGQPEVKEATVSIADTAKSLSGIARKWDERSDGLADGIRDLVADLDDVAKRADERLGPLAEDVQKSVVDLQATLDQLKKTLQAVEDSVGGDSSIVRDTRLTLRSLAETLDSLRAFTDYLQRHPEALLRGKSED